MLEQVHWRATKTIRRLGDMVSEERLRELSFLICKKRGEVLLLSRATEQDSIEKMELGSSQSCTGIG